MASLFENNERGKYSLCEDWTFHYVFSKDAEENRKALMGLLNVILGRREDPITRIQLLNPFYYGRNRAGKGSVLDIKAETDSGELIDIEMQNGDLEYYGHRSLLYGGRLMNSSLEKGQKYDKMKKSIVISITSRILYPQLDRIHSIFRVYNERNDGTEPMVLMSDRLEFHYLELGKLDGKKPVQQLTAVEKVAAYLKYAGDEKHEAYTQDLLNEGGEEIAMMEHVFRELTADEIAREIRISEELAEITRLTQESIREQKMLKRLTDEVTAKVTDEVTAKVTDEVTAKVTDEVTAKVTDEVTAKVTDEVTARVNRLNLILAEQGRMEELKRSFVDEEFQKGLMKELNI